MLLNVISVDNIIRNALQEDIGTGDLTTLSIIPVGSVTDGFIYAKAAGVVAGLAVAKRVFEILNSEVRFVAQKADGDRIAKGDILALISGPAQAVLSGERVCLNLLQRMSGIATRTAGITAIIKDYKTVVVDTRKTTPGLRILEKYAVVAGGGKNHRFGLYDAVLIKDNHIKVAGGIQKAVALAKANAPHTAKIEVEVENLEGVNEALAAKADIIMLDNMNLDTIREAVKAIGGKALVEVSGGVNESNVLDYAKAGVDIVSVGALTHSVKALDISLDVGEIKMKNL
ncbi:MAG: carboxylating nicotinate-nucleotide diphosphorylase [Thermincola sp.]|nr:carboxylating nicotinate-nucleotide diphosphorylase [Thermincola sp.]MDT3702163.1 carboxylating nicotinate-nucleotide diphosphorylase [Thermincola sp.]